MFFAKYFFLKGLAAPHDAWKIFKSVDLLDISVLHRAQEIGLFDCYITFIEANSNLGIHVAGFFLGGSVEGDAKRHTSTLYVSAAKFYTNSNTRTVSRRHTQSCFFHSLSLHCCRGHRCRG